MFDVIQRFHQNDSWHLARWAIHTEASPRLCYIVLGILEFNLNVLLERVKIRHLRLSPLMTVASRLAVASFTQLSSRLPSVQLTRLHRQKGRETLPTSGPALKQLLRP